ncbi:MAG TPA: Ku protein [Acidimicrobiia bacterium]|nr:Ku protein [Acidimicrobiia bacterium]
MAAPNPPVIPGAERVELVEEARMAQTKDLNGLTKEELYELAQERDIEGRSKMGKDELVEALEGDGSISNGRTPNSDDGLDRPTTSERAIWRGAINFGLITIPVGLYSATEDRDISFHLLSGKDGSRIRYKRVSSKSGREVDWGDIVKGYEYDKGKYVTFTQEELERIPVDSIRTIDVVQFVGQEGIDPIYFEKSYYLAPEESGLKAYRVFQAALENSQQVGIGKVTIREKERLCAIRPSDGVLLLETMKWPDEIRVPAFEELDMDVEVRPKEVEMAESLIGHLSGEFDPTAFRDAYREQLEEVIAAKIEGEDVQLAPQEAPEPEKVTDLLEALQASVEATRKRSA